MKDIISCIEELRLKLDRHRKEDIKEMTARPNDWQRWHRRFWSSRTPVIFNLRLHRAEFF